VDGTLARSIHHRQHQLQPTHPVYPRRWKPGSGASSGCCPPTADHLRNQQPLLAHGFAIRYPGNRLLERRPLIFGKGRQRKGAQCQTWAGGVQATTSTGVGGAAQPNWLGAVQLFAEFAGSGRALTTSPMAHAQAWIARPTPLLSRPLDEAIGANPGAVIWANCSAWKSFADDAASWSAGIPWRDAGKQRLANTIHQTWVVGGSLLLSMCR